MRMTPARTFLAIILAVLIATAILVAVTPAQGQEMTEIAQVIYDTTDMERVSCEDGLRPLYGDHTDHLLVNLYTTTWVLWCGLYEEDIDQFRADLALARYQIGSGGSIWWDKPNEDVDFTEIPVFGATYPIWVIRNVPSGSLVIVGRGP